MAEDIVTEATCNARMNGVKGDLVEIKQSLAKLEVMLNPKMDTLLILDQRVKQHEEEIKELKKRPMKTIHLVLTILGSPVIIGIFFLIYKLYPILTK